MAPLNRGSCLSRRTASSSGNRTIVAQARCREESLDTTRAALVVDQVFGLLWYRLIFGNAALDKRTATELANAAALQLRA
jgi:hypothetical protein